MCKWPSAVCFLIFSQKQMPRCKKNRKHYLILCSVYLWGSYSCYLVYVTAALALVFNLDTFMTVKLKTLQLSVLVGIVITVMLCITQYTA